jgi:hypothetical protein
MPTQENAIADGPPPPPLERSKMYGLASIVVGLPFWVALIMSPFLNRITSRAESFFAIFLVFGTLGLYVGTYLLTLVAGVLGRIDLARRGPRVLLGNIGMYMAILASIVVWGGIIWNLAT